MTHILFNIASRSRPEKFAKLVSVIHNFCTQPFTILGKIDEDDPRLPEYFKTEGVQFALGRSLNKIHAINRDIPADGWDIIVDVSDDFVFTMPFFDTLIRQECGPDDYLHFPEPFADKEAATGKNERIVILYCAGIDYFKRDGWIYNPVYKSLFCDNEGTAVAKIRGRYKLIEKDIFFHAHPSAGYGVMDVQTKKTEAFHKEDQETYNKRKLGGFAL